MNVLKKILEEINEKIKFAGRMIVEKPCDKLDEIANDTAESFISAYEACSETIHSHIDEIPNCEGCSRRKWYQKGFEDGKKDNDWILVEEGLPEEGMGELIVTDEDGNVYMNITYGYAEDNDKEPTFHRWDEEWWYCYKYNVVAWRLKPEPYIKNLK